MVRLSVHRLILTTLALAAAGAAAQPVQIPGTRVTMDPPEGFVLAADFPGFVSRDPRATITVVEVPSSFIELTERYSDERLARDGIVIMDRRQIERDGLRAVLLTGNKKAGARRTVKRMLMTGDVSESLLVTASYLRDDQARIGAQIEYALRTLLWDSSRLIDHFEGIGFRLREIPGLRVATRVSNSIVFTPDGTLPDQYYTGQMLIVGWSKSDVSSVENRRAFAEKRFRELSLLTDALIDRSENVVEDGVEGIEIVGHGTHRKLGYDVAAFQVMLFYPDRLLLAQGFTNADNPEPAFNQFRTIMDTVSTDD